VWKQRFALALATMIETGNGSDADLMLRGYVSAVCARLHMPADAHDVLQETWASILTMARSHVAPPKIADLVRTIAYRRAVDVVRRRERFRSAESAWLAGEATEAVFEPDEVDVEGALATLLRGLKDDNERQHSAVTLALQCSNHEEARLRWESVHSAQITPETFRQMHSRGVRKMRRYWEQSND
jgi:DNA-directed RNA polymerase specialized sigma24 family protein